MPPLSLEHAPTPKLNTARSAHKPRKIDTAAKFFGSVVIGWPQAWAGGCVVRSNSKRVKIPSGERRPLTGAPSRLSRDFPVPFSHEFSTRAFTDGFGGLLASSSRRVSGPLVVWRTE